MDFSNIGNWIVIIYFVFLTFYLFSFLKKKNRLKTKDANKKLEEFRKISVKSLDEQKEFLAVRYPKSTGKFTFKSLGPLLIKLASFILFFRIYIYIFDYLGIVFNLLYGLLFIMICPILINFVLKRFNLHTTDLTIFFRK